MRINHRADILQVALQLFSNRGYDAVGVYEIAVTAGVTKPTLYYYFGSKNGILEAILREYGDRLVAAARAAAAYEGDLWETLKRLVNAYFHYASNNPSFYRMQLAMYFAPPESEPNQFIRRTNELQHGLLEELFRQAAQHHGNMRGRQLAFAATFLGTVNTYIGFALNGYIELDEALAEQAVHQFMFGIYA